MLLAQQYFFQLTVILFIEVVFNQSQLGGLRHWMKWTAFARCLSSWEKGELSYEIPKRSSFRARCGTIPPAPYAYSNTRVLILLLDSEALSGTFWNISLRSFRCYWRAYQVAASIRFPYLYIMSLYSCRKVVLLIRFHEGLVGRTFCQRMRQLSAAVPLRRAYELAKANHHW